MRRSWERMAESGQHVQHSITSQLRSAAKACGLTLSVDGEFENGVGATLFLFEQMEPAEYLHRLRHLRRQGGT